MNENTHQIKLLPGKIITVLGLLAVALGLVNIARIMIKYLTSHNNLYGLLRLFDLDAESNIPTFFSSSILLFAALLLGVIALFKKKDKDPYMLQWTVLSCGFFYLSLDEAVMIHELLNRPTVEILGHRPSGILFFAWVIPGFFITSLLLMVFLKFLNHLPGKTKILFLISGMVYISGALGMEMLGGYCYALHDIKTLTYEMITMIEEFLEMAGVIIFIYALLEYIENHYAETRLQFGKIGPQERVWMAPRFKEDYQVTNVVGVTRYDALNH